MVLSPLWDEAVCWTNPSCRRRVAGRYGMDSGSAPSLRLVAGVGTLFVAVVPVPPLVGRSLRVARRRVLPRLLASERRDVEIVPGTSHLLVAAAVDEVGAEDAPAVADEHV